MEDKEKEMQLKVEIFKGLCHYHHNKTFMMSATELASKANYAYEALMKDYKEK